MRVRWIRREFDEINVYRLGMHKRLGGLAAGNRTPSIDGVKFA
jgi:hypothetical protein